MIRGERRVRISDGREADIAGVSLANEMLADGGDVILGMRTGALAGYVFLLPRTQDRTSRIAAALREAGAEVVEARDSAAAAAALAGRTPNALLFPSSGSVATITDYLNALHEANAKPLVAAMGPASAAAAEAGGWRPDIVGAEADIASFVHTVTHFVLEHVS